MTKPPTILLLAFNATLLASCGPPAEEKLAKLDALHNSTLADLVRHQAECEALDIEFQGSRLQDRVVETCWKTHDILEEMADRTIENIEKRRAEITSQQSQARPGAFDDLIPRK